ncbi:MULTISPECIES: 2-hydroxychromene-2-carboxylate isomerase [unclassified Mesorhizobium]|uniref:2-hydroxychromene-2-carboxylate isomerase n=1 Tax=unclassified Mesorhizobium TaxID=325217 RepID=UPI000BB05DA7|nr:MULTISPECIES: 2-hydroxychromene-2-carboxylate isomerase [unclassified Mesorhizobium]TGT63588.1 2-hydroxychromene-2-carboxylate isomerase [Mesorhizobium sp. M00.F.Ca.ET.170.01.1.1]AZO11326.1 2-hydroxychromene-2-carboxylate isomerase [Mesorhizobium sp. M3A.F.Ca.ET.080.04.2.1]PBB88426.1 2-hydroxychromene-2-carboxylate isomerase [Mesorhizobium sp. WSM3876]RWB76644.1 MAG: 2-hydroxychromene-2-carboxylate isomerase [Mesorhizobium sp.]RWB92178.1 MAG: 2-hydroxychromene-2-carboxylate isomerase [Mesor
MIDFWFSIGSTYTYLSVMRLAEVGAEAHVQFRWRPFNVRAIMIEMDNIPFATKPAKAAYMWRDIERRAAMYRMAPRLPAPYPLAELERANRVALIAARDGWCEAYARESYRRWFEMDEPAGSEPNISASIEKAGQKPEPILRQADSDAAKADLARATEQAKALGIFGSPSFVVDGELFWGDDRLDDAIRWLKQMESGPPD